MALQLELTGIVDIAAAGFAYLFIFHIRNLEAELSDHDQLQKLETQQ